jgi:hypothetical protein
MKLAELKDYLQNRGVSVNSHLKPGLIATACAVEEMNLPLISKVSAAEEKWASIGVQTKARYNPM